MSHRSRNFPRWQPSFEVTRCNALPVATLLLLRNHRLFSRKLLFETDKRFVCPNRPVSVRCRLVEPILSIRRVVCRIFENRTVTLVERLRFREDRIGNQRLSKIAALALR